MTGPSYTTCIHHRDLVDDQRARVAPSLHRVLAAADAFNELLQWNIS